ncbi:hypothetical protein B0O80DRAFT_112186 [Mortierella sp. GBAus27b]|nr:hypothetical protein BGX31_011053 [Mortierella sp. GBA43]KAI8351713.1 hypothetical protein B0O80DRAFT_112186 [Mortierella sp. GBAus27b]
MEGAPQGGLSLDELVTKVWPSLDTHVPASSGLKKPAARPRVIAESSLPHAAAGGSQGDRGSNGAFLHSSEPGSMMTPIKHNHNVPTRGPPQAPLPPDMAIAAASIYGSGSSSNIGGGNGGIRVGGELAEQKNVATGGAVTSVSTITAKGAKRKEAPEEEGQGSSGTLTNEAGSSAGGPGGVKKGKKRRKTKHNSNNSNNNNNGANHDNAGNETAPQNKLNKPNKPNKPNHSQTQGQGQAQGRSGGFSKRRNFKNDSQVLIRNLDATPDLVGLSAEEDFSTLLLQHVEHKNKMIERDLKRQKQIIAQEQKKQAELMASQASQAAQLVNPSSSSSSSSSPPPPPPSQQKQQQQQPQKQFQQYQHQQQQPQQQQQQFQQRPKQHGPRHQNQNQHQPSGHAPPGQLNPQEPPAPFIPRRDCVFYMKGRCPKGDNCTFKHDQAARDAQQLIPESEETRRARGVCKYERRGACLKGALCRFSHDLSAEPCLFYHLKGVCENGVLCRYGHVPISEEQLRALQAGGFRE